MVAPCCCRFSSFIVWMTASPNAHVIFRLEMAKSQSPSGLVQWYDVPDNVFLPIATGKKKPYTALLQCRTFLCGKKMGSTEERFRWWIWLSGFFIWSFCIHHRLGKFFFEAKNVLQWIFFRWWLCTPFSSLSKLSLSRLRACRSSEPCKKLRLTLRALGFRITCLLW